MEENSPFDLLDFMPYLLNQAAETASREFSENYKLRYGMLQTEWRVLFHLGRYGKMTAKDICDRGRIHKTKVSRAVHALVAKKYLSRETDAHDRRHEVLSLTQAGQRTFDDLYQRARSFDDALMAEFDAAEKVQLRKILAKIAKL